MDFKEEPTLIISAGVAYIFNGHNYLWRTSDTTTAIWIGRNNRSESNLEEHAEVCARNVGQDISVVVLGNLPFPEDIRTGSDSCLFVRRSQRITVLFYVGICESERVSAQVWGVRYQELTCQMSACTSATNSQASHSREYRFGGPNNRQHCVEYLPFD